MKRTAIRPNHFAKRFEAMALLALRAYETLDEEQVLWQPNPTSNSATTLMLHMAGALRHFVVRQIGGSDYERDRDAEFGTAAEWNSKAVAVDFRKALDEVAETFKGLSEDDFFTPSADVLYYYDTVGEDLLGAIVHMSVHVGQIVQISKELVPGGLDESWVGVHGEAGVWKIGAQR